MTDIAREELTTIWWNGAIYFFEDVSSHLSWMCLFNWAELTTD